MMDDDFNTAGAIAVMHELAGEINGFIEKSGVEKSKDPAAVAAAAAATRSPQGTRPDPGHVPLPRPGARGRQAARTPAWSDQLMQLLIQVRADARKAKNFAIADAIRKGLTEIGITLEDRADGTIWRKG